MLKFGCAVIIGLVVGLFLGFALVVVSAQLLKHLFS